jgi:hypothetical protein
VSEVASPAARLHWLEQLARAFPTTSYINLTLGWENEHGTAGVQSFEGESFVFLHNAQQSVESLAEATNLLRAIFADELVAVSAYADGQFLHCGLAPKTDPSANFGGLRGAEYVTIETWSGGLQEDE